MIRKKEVKVMKNFRNNEMLNITENGIFAEHNSLEITSDFSF